MAITLVQQSPGNRGSGNTSITVVLTLPAPVTSGNKVIVSLFGGPAGAFGAITDDKGNSYAIDEQQANGFFGTSIFASASLANITNGPSVITAVFTGGASIVTGGVAYEVSSGGALDLFGQTESGFGTGPFSDTFTTNFANEYGFGILQMSSVSAATANNGWAVDYADTSDSMVVYSKALPTAGSNTATFTPSGSSVIFFTHATYQTGSAGLVTPSPIYHRKNVLYFI
jgi:hypothetical protein